MSLISNRHSSIYFRLGRLLLLALAVAVLCFLSVHRLGEALVDHYIIQSDYSQRRDARYVEKLQAYIRENNLSTRDKDQLAAWVDRQGIIAVQVYQDGRLLYDSLYPESVEWSELTEMESDQLEQPQYDWMEYYTIQFADGGAEVTLFGFYEFRFMQIALFTALGLSFFIFFLIVMLGIRKSMRYIRLLGKEIGILEGGNLDYQVTIQGRDELADLAKGLDSMRQAFQTQTEHEREITQTNQRMVTEMSHDLRTPLTSIMLYTELLRQHKYDSPEKQAEYLEKIDRKARQMKQLSDRLFEYSLITGATEVELEAPLLFQQAFYDLLSETTSYLEQKGFSVQLELDWQPRYVSVNQDYISRIFDNLTSNLLKYADADQTIQVKTLYQSGFSGFSFQNAILREEKREESTKIGLQNIKRMMEKMGGSCVTEQTAGTFELQLMFRQTT